MNVAECNWINHMPVPMVVLDNQMEIVEASRPVFSMFHTRYRSAQREECLQDLGAFLLNRPTFVSAVGMMTMKLRRLGSRDKIRWQDGGRTYDIEVFTLPPEEEPSFGLVFEDITKRIEFERSRETTRNYLEQMIDSLPLGIVVIDCDMRITAMNRVQQEFLQMNGSPSARLQAVGASIVELLPRQENINWQSVRETLFEQGYPIRDIEYIYGQNKTQRIFSVDLIPLLDKMGEVIGAMHITEEVTEKRRLQAEAQESEVLVARLDTLKQIVATLNHVVNNTLTGMICNLEMIRSLDDPISEDKISMVDEVMLQAHSIAEFIQNLMDLKEIRITDYLEGEKMLDV